MNYSNPKYIKANAVNFFFEEQCQIVKIYILIFSFSFFVKNTLIFYILVIYY